jgi:hypothetical protein
VSNTDPEHKVHDRPSPKDRVHISPDPDAVQNQVSNQRQEHYRSQRRKAKQHVPKQWLRIFGDTANHVRYRAIRLITCNQLRSAARNIGCVVDFSRVKEFEILRIYLAMKHDATITPNIIAL